MKKTTVRSGQLSPAMWANVRVRPRTESSVKPGATACLLVQEGLSALWSDSLNK